MLGNSTPCLYTRQHAHFWVCICKMTLHSLRVPGFISLNSCCMKNSQHTYFDYLHRSYLLAFLFMVQAPQPCGEILVPCLSNFTDKVASSSKDSLMPTLAAEMGCNERGRVLERCWSCRQSYLLPQRSGNEFSVIRPQVIVPSRSYLYSFILSPTSLIKVVYKAWGWVDCCLLYTKWVEWYLAYMKQVVSVHEASGCVHEASPVALHDPSEWLHTQSEWLCTWSKWLRTRSEWSVVLHMHPDRVACCLVYTKGWSVVYKRWSVISGSLSGDFYRN